MYRSIETGHVLKGAATEFLNSRQEICEQLGKRIQQVNKLLVKWKLQPRDNSSNDEMGDAMPAKFLMLSDSCIAELVRPCTVQCPNYKLFNVMHPGKKPPWMALKTMSVFARCSFYTL